MGLRRCEVTVETSDGKRHTITVNAFSVFRAAMEFFSRSRAPNPGEFLPRTGESTVYEVRVLYRVTEKALMAWANRKSERVNKRR